MAYAKQLIHKGVVRQTITWIISAYYTCVVNFTILPISRVNIPRPLNRFSWNLNYITTSWKRPRVHNFMGLRRRWWSEKIARRMKVYVLCATSTRPQIVYLHTHPQSVYTWNRHTDIRRSGRSSASSGLQRRNLKCNPLSTPIIYRN